MKKILFSLLILIACMGMAQAQDNVPKVLFIGNSYTEVNNLPMLVKQVTQSAGRDISYEANMPGGCTFAGHCNNQSMSMIQQGGWDFVVLQAQSQEPSFPDAQVNTETMPYAAQLAQAVYQYNPQGEAMFYMTWGRKYGDEQNGSIFPPIATYEGMDSMLYLRYMMMKEQNNASVCPVGRLWRYIRSNYPQIELYSGDNSHPSIAGSYAAACAFYTMIFKDSPLNITFNSSVNDNDAAIIRQACKTVVLDSMFMWERAEAEPEESINVLFIGNSYTSVNNLPELVKTVSESADRRIEVSSNTPGGCTFQQHLSNQSLTMIRQGGWDYVVLQEQSQLPSFPMTQVEAQCMPYAASLVNNVYSYNPDGEAMFYMTWGRKDGDASNAGAYPPLGTYEGMDSLLFYRYMIMKMRNDASVSPVGRLWHYIRSNHPEIELYSTDGSHPSLAGSYAAACSFYTMLFHASPMEITNDAGVPAATAATIRNAAKTVVFDSIDIWQRGGEYDTTCSGSTQNIVDIADLQVLVYPNPASERIDIYVDGNTMIESVVLCDLQGRIVMKNDDINGSLATLNIDNLRNGIYMVRINTKGGSIVRKIVKATSNN